MEKLSKPLENGNMKWFLLILAAFLGVILLISPGKAEAETEKNSYEEAVANAEEKIKSLCEKVKGVGETAVAVTLLQEGENLSQSETRICGIGIVCEGGEDPEVIYRLLSLVSAACDVSSDKIYITGLEKDNALIS